MYVSATAIAPSSAGISMSSQVMTDLEKMVTPAPDRSRIPTTLRSKIKEWARSMVIILRNN